MEQGRREEVSERGELQDQVLTCENCRQEFARNAGAQAFFREKGLTSEPKLCQDCIQANRQRRDEQEATKGVGT